MSITAARLTAAAGALRAWTHPSGETTLLPTVTPHGAEGDSRCYYYYAASPHCSAANLLECYVGADVGDILAVPHIMFELMPACPLDEIRGVISLNAGHGFPGGGLGINNWMIEALLAAKWVVICDAMPNILQDSIAAGWPLEGGTGLHDKMRTLEKAFPRARMLRYFTDSLGYLMRYAKAQYGKVLAVAGLSGGDYTCTIAKCLYPDLGPALLVYGGSPLATRAIDLPVDSPLDQQAGDWEQQVKGIPYGNGVVLPEGRAWHSIAASVGGGDPYSVYYGIVGRQKYPSQKWWGVGDTAFPLTPIRGQIDVLKTQLQAIAPNLTILYDPGAGAGSEDDHQITRYIFRSFATNLLGFRVVGA